VDVTAMAVGHPARGVITGTLGGTIDEILTGRRATIMSEGHWLLSVVVLGAVTFWLFTIYIGFYLAVAVTVILVAGLRALSVSLNWTSPIFPGDDLHSADS
jgi:uncharacterized membrane protein YeiH